MQSVRHRYSGVNRGGVASCTSNRSMYVKVAKNLKGREKAKVWLWRIEMVVTEDIMVICITKLRVNRAYVLKVLYVLYIRKNII